MTTSPTRLEADLIADLAAAFAPIRVINWPDDIERHQLRDKAEIMVGFRGGPWAPPQHGTAAQVRGVDLEVGVACKSMAGPQGATALLERLARHLQGRKLPEARPIHIVSDHFHGRMPGIWLYGLKVRIPGVVSLPLPPVSQPAPLSRVRVQSGFGPLEITR